MKLFPAALSLAAALCLTALETAPAQTPTSQFTDPANLRGERVSPLTGRELPIDQGASGLQQLLRKLNTRASLMLIVAHPDDEDGGMLTYYSRGLGARVADLSLNRGEGGQNAMTADFEDALGLLRTQELLAADRYFDADQLFGTEVDFGFSKTKEEAFAKWTHERVLYDVVRAIRIYRPLVIASVWIGGVTDGHGQHQASGQITQEAFLAAGDPKVFPELTAEGILPWQPLKVYARVPMQSITDKGLYDYATNQYTPARFTNYVTGEVTTTTPSTDVIIHEGTTDPLLTNAAANPSDLPNKSADPKAKLSYVQFARIGLSLQKSQIGTNMRIPPAGAYDTAYHLYGSRLCPTTIAASQPAEGKSATRKNSVILSAAKDPCISPAAALPPSDSHLDPGFFDGIDTSIESIANLAPDAPPILKEQLHNITVALNDAAQHFNPAYPTASIPALGKAQMLLYPLRHSLELASNAPLHATSLIEIAPWAETPRIQLKNVLHELLIKSSQLEEALSLAAGITFDAATSTSNTLTNELIDVHTTASTQAIGCELGSTWLRNASDLPNFTSDDLKTQPLSMSSQPSVQGTLKLEAKYTGIVTRPYFERKTIEQPFYDLRNPILRNAPQAPPALLAFANFHCNGASSISTFFTVARVVHSGPQPVSFIPPVGLTLEHNAQVLLPATHSFNVPVNIQTSQPYGEVRLHTPLDWAIRPATQTLAPGDLTFFVLLPIKPLTKSATLTAEANSKPTGHYTEGYRPIGYGDLPITNYYTPATTRIVPVDLTLPTRHNIAYLPGTGDSIPEALTSINLKPTILTIADLTPANLAQYDTVILGVRTYAAHPNLHGAPTQALLDYARNGGNVVVQYQTPEFTAADAPYPLSLGSNEKVVDETSPVALLDPGKNRYPEASASGLIGQKKEGALAPEYALLTTPNKITPSDFNNWVEERGHGFLSTWDSHYTALTETHDPGQLPQRGGLITTPLGKGHWTYVAFALYRQLPEAVPGAYRLYINLLTP